MKRIKSLMGRRQFLVAAGVASTSVLACKRLAGMAIPIRQPNRAKAEEKENIAGGKAASDKYPHLLSPLKIRNKVLKNRILQPRSDPHLLQGPENFPADGTRSFYSRIAKNAAIVSIHTRFTENIGIFPTWDDIPAVHNYFDQLIEDIHCEGSLAGIGELEGDTVEEVVTNAKKWEDKGYDVVGFERMFGGREELEPFVEKLQAIRNATDLLTVTFLSPYSPEFPWSSYMSSGGMPGGMGGAAGGGGMPPGGPMPGGGPPGEDMPEGGTRGDARPGDRRRAMGGGTTSTGPELEEVVKIAGILDGASDILVMKPSGQKHQNSFTMERDQPWALPFAQAIKESGADIITCPNGGFHDPALNDEWIASGKTDMIAMATSLIADPEYVKKINEDRLDDIVPCLKCHDCHAKISTTEGPCFSICNVNPTHGLSETKKRSIPPAHRSRRVAVIGGGPAGMKAAITAAERGHRVTLYEKDDALGGLQRHVDLTKWRWAYRDYKDYLIRQVKKAGVEVKLKTAATPGMIKSKGYDALLVAVGAKPAVSKIPGADGRNVFNIVDVYDNMDSLGENVVLIGGGVYGSETGIVLVQEGFKVTALTAEDHMIPARAIGSHNKQNQLWIIEGHPDFNYILEAIVTRIADGKVFYKDAAGSEKSVRADSVVIYAGLKPRTDEALKFSDAARQVLLLGDCTGTAGTIQKAIRSAFFMASQV
jgi:thioredoxin reductase